MSPDTLTPQQIESMTVDYINNDLTVEAKKTFEAHLSKHPDLQHEIETLNKINECLLTTRCPDIPEPSERMDQRFYDMLAQESKAQMDKKKADWLDTLTQWFQIPKVQKFTYSMGFMMVGMFIGHYAHLINQHSTLESERMAIKKQQVQALAVLSMLDMPSANKRIMAVQLAGLDNAPDSNMFDALLSTLKQDENVNVRLEALEVLASHTGNKQVRSGLINAISAQDSPMLQIALANLMLLLEEKKAIAPIKQLMEKPELNDTVKSQLNQTLNELI